MKISNVIDAKFAALVKDKKLSPCDAACRLREDRSLNGVEIPCTSTWYGHIWYGEIIAHYREMPCHLDKAHRKGSTPHLAKTVVGGLWLSERPNEANNRFEPGHY